MNTRYGMNLLTLTSPFLQSGIPPAEQDLYHNGKELVDLKKTMEQYGVEDDDMLLMQRKRAPAGTR